MKIPDTIRIANRDVAIKYAKMDGLFGQYDPKESTITLNKDNSKMQMIETFWHELIHAVNDYNRVGVEIADEIAAGQMDGSDPEMRGWMLEERLTENFAKIFPQVIKENNLLNLTP